MGRSSTVELRFLVPAVGGSNPSVPAIKTERPKPITARGAFLWASGGIRTRKGAELRKREAFSSAARKERSDAAERGRRKGGRGIPPSHISRECLASKNISPVPKSEPPSTKWRVAPAGRALSLSRVPHAKKATNLDVLDVTARGVLVWQGDVKQGGADLLVAPPKLNVRLPCQGPSQRREDRRSVERRN